MARRSGLGKGLGSLIPAGTDDTGDGGTTRLAEVSVDDITPNPYQPRVHFDEESLGDLTESIRQIGILQPILVRQTDDAYELIAGERRWRAAQRAGLATVPAIVRAADDLGSMEQALVENLHRQDLTPLEEAAAYNQLLEDFELTHEQVAERVGKSRAAVTNTLRLLGLPPGVQRLLTDGRLSAGHARALLGTPDRSLQEALAQQAVDEGWTVRAVEQAVRGGPTDSADDPPADSTPEPLGDGAGITPLTRLRPPGLLEIEKLLAERLNTSVSINMGTRKGRVSIEFADLSDLERIYDAMFNPSEA